MRQWLRGPAISRRPLSYHSPAPLSTATAPPTPPRVCSDSYKSPCSVIFIDDIERIIDYSRIGPRFSNTVLQTLLVLIRKVGLGKAHALLAFT